MVIFSGGDGGRVDSVYFYQYEFDSCWLFGIFFFLLVLQVEEGLYFFLLVF